MILSYLSVSRYVYQSTVSRKTNWHHAESIDTIYQSSFDLCVQESPQFSRIFTHAAHKGVVKALAADGPYVASGGADDLIHLYDLYTNTDLGFLMNPGEGAVTALCFFVPQTGYSPTHLLAGCADGTISVWNIGGDWECMKALKGHRGEVTDITVHPSGRLALTTSRDGSLRLWDLVKGRATFTTKVEGIADSVSFSPSGSAYSIVCGSVVTIKSLEVGGQNEEVFLPLHHTSRVHCQLWGHGDHVLMTGAEDGSLRIWNAKSGREMLCIKGSHARRIKSLAHVYSNDACQRSESTGPQNGQRSTLESNNRDKVMRDVPEILATASSDGIIKLWNLKNAMSRLIDSQDSSCNVIDEEDDIKASCLCSTDTRARITVLAAVDPPQVMEEKIRMEMEQRRHMKRKQKNEKKKAVQEKPSSKGSTGKGPQRAAEQNGPKTRKKQQKKEHDAHRVSKDSSKKEYVDFMDEKDAERDRKRKRKVQLMQAQRSAQRSKKTMRNKSGI